MRLPSALTALALGPALSATAALADQPFAGSWAHEDAACSNPWLTVTDDTLRDGATLSCTFSDITETAPGTFAVMASCNGAEAEDWTIRVHDGVLTLINAVDFGDGRISRWHHCGG